MNAEVLNVGQRRLAIQRALQHYFHGARLDQVVGDNSDVKFEYR